MSISGVPAPNENNAYSKYEEKDMADHTKQKGGKCCSTEHDRLVAELDTCDRLHKTPSEWHRCARVIARRSSQRVKECMLQA